MTTETNAQNRPLYNFLAESRQLLDAVEPQLPRVDFSQTSGMEQDFLHVLLRLFHFFRRNAPGDAFPGIREISIEMENLLDLMQTGLLAPDPRLRPFFYQACRLLRSILDASEGEHPALQEEAQRLVSRVNQLVEELLGPGEKEIHPAPSPTEQGEIVSDKIPQVAELVLSDEMVGRFSEEAAHLLEKAQGSLEVWKPDEGKEGEMAPVVQALHSLKGICGYWGFQDTETLCQEGEKLADAFLTGRLADSADNLDILKQLIHGVDKNLESIAATGRETPCNVGLWRRMIHRLFTEEEAAPQEEVDLATQAEAVAETLPPGESSAPYKVVYQNRIVELQDARFNPEKIEDLNRIIQQLVRTETALTYHPATAEILDAEWKGLMQRCHRLMRELQDVSAGLRVTPMGFLFQQLQRLALDLAFHQGKQVDVQIEGESVELDKAVADKLAEPLAHLVMSAVEKGLETEQERVAQGKPAVATLSLKASRENEEVWIICQDDGRPRQRQDLLKKGVEGRVQDELNRLNVQMDLLQPPGKGATLVLRVPGGQKIVEGTVVRLGPVRYTVPTLSIRDRLEKVERDCWELREGQWGLGLDEEWLPVVRLEKFHQLQPNYADWRDAALLILEEGGEAACLPVDEIMAHQESVIKDLPEYFDGVRGAAGSTLLDSGDISVILDVGGILEMAKIKSLQPEENPGKETL